MTTEQIVNQAGPQPQEIHVKDLFAKIGEVVWMTGIATDQITELRSMCSALETENKELKEQLEKTKVEK